MVKDDTSSLLWLRDADSCYSERSAFEENSELLDTIFDFDLEVFKSKAYLLAMRSNMKHEIASRTSSAMQQEANFTGMIMDADDLHGGDNNGEDEDAETIREASTSSSPFSGRHTMWRDRDSQTCAEVDGYVMQREGRKPYEPHLAQLISARAPGSNMTYILRDREIVISYHPGLQNQKNP